MVEGSIDWMHQGPKALECSIQLAYGERMLQPLDQLPNIPKSNPFCASLTQHQHQACKKCPATRPSRARTRCCACTAGGGRPSPRHPRRRIKTHRRRRRPRPRVSLPMPACLPGWMYATIDRSRVPARWCGMRAINLQVGRTGQSIVNRSMYPSSPTPSISERTRGVSNATNHVYKQVRTCWGIPSCTGASAPTVAGVTCPPWRRSWTRGTPHVRMYMYAAYGLIHRKVLERSPHNESTQACSSPPEPTSASRAAASRPPTRGLNPPSHPRAEGARCSTCGSWRGMRGVTARRRSQLLAAAAAPWSSFAPTAVAMGTALAALSRPLVGLPMPSS